MLPSPRNRPLPLLVVLLLGGLAAGWTYYLAQSEGHARAQASFQKLLAARAASVESRMRSSLETLHFLAALYNSSEVVTRDEFASFTKVALARYPEIEAVMWAPRVTAGEREAHVADARARLAADYEITQRSEGQEPIVAESRAEYFPVLFAERRQDSSPSAGVDLAYESERRRALHRAVATGQPQLTNPVRLVRDAGTGTGVLGILAVWRSGPAMATMQERLDRLLGVVVLAWNVEDLVATATGEDPDGTYRDLAVELRDSEGDGGWLTLSSGIPPVDASGLASQDTQARFTVGGCRMRLLAYQGPAFEATARTDRPMLLGSLAFVVAALAAGAVLAWLLRESKAKDARLQHLTTAVAQSADVIFITDRGGQFLYVNKGFEETTGYASDEVLGKTPRILRSGLHGQAHYGRMWSTVLSGKVYRGTIANRRKDGSIWYGEQSITPIKDLDGHVTDLVSVTKDMTERMLLHEREAEVRLAAIIQQGLYPRPGFRFGGLDLAGAAFPVGFACGDYYDLMELPDGTLGMAIGDVCGHGIGPALIMVAARARLRSWLAAGSSIIEAVTYLNEVLCCETPDDSFVSLMLARFDPRAGQLTYVNAGHPQGFVVAANGLDCTELTQTGPVLGIMPDAVFTAGRAVEVGDGDVIALMTDGITEVQSSQGELFESTRVWSILQRHRRESAREILEALHASVGTFAAGEKPQDDLTILIGKLVARGTETAAVPEAP